MSVTPRRRPFQELTKNCRPGPTTMGVVRANRNSFSPMKDGTMSSSTQKSLNVPSMTRAARGQANAMFRS